ERLRLSLAEDQLGQPTLINLMDRRWIGGVTTSRDSGDRPLRLPEALFPAPMQLATARTIIGRPISRDARRVSSLFWSYHIGWHLRNVEALVPEVERDFSVRSRDRSAVCVARHWPRPGRPA